MGKIEVGKIATDKGIISKEDTSRISIKGTSSGKTMGGRMNTQTTSSMGKTRISLLPTETTNSTTFKGRTNHEDKIKATITTIIRKKKISPSNVSGNSNDSMIRGNLCHNSK